MLSFTQASYFVLWVSTTAPVASISSSDTFVTMLLSMLSKMPSHLVSAYRRWLWWSPTQPSLRTVNFTLAFSTSIVGVTMVLYSSVTFVFVFSDVFMYQKM